MSILEFPCRWRTQSAQEIVLLRRSPTMLSAAVHCRCFQKQQTVGERGWQRNEEACRFWMKIPGVRWMQPLKKRSAHKNNCSRIDSRMIRSISTGNAWDVRDMDGRCFVLLIG